MIPTIKQRSYGFKKGELRTKQLADQGRQVNNQLRILRARVRRLRAEELLRRAHRSNDTHGVETAARLTRKVDRL